METFTLSRKELHRPGLLKALCGGRLTNAQVAAALRITLRQVRGQLGHPPRRARRAPRVRRRRVPSAARGALIQIDGSPFPWLEDRGPELMLLGAIDDATSEILALQFRPAEDVHGYVTLFRDVFTAHGLPMAVYGDRLNLLVRNDAHWSVEEQLAGTQAPTARRCGAGRRAISPSASAAATAAWSPATTPCASGLAWCSSVARAPTPG